MPLLCVSQNEENELVIQSNIGIMDSSYLNNVKFDSVEFLTDPKFLNTHLSIKLDEKYKFLKLDQLRGKDFSENRVSISNLPESDFIQYYNSISEEMKLRILSSTIWNSSTSYGINIEREETKNFIHSEYIRLSKEQESYNYLFKKRLKFIASTQFKNSVDTIFNVLTSDYSFKIKEVNAELLNYLNYENKELKALEVYKKLLDSSLKSIEDDNFVEYIRLTSTEFITNFLFHSNEEVRKIFITHSLAAIKNDLQSFQDLRNLIYILWQSELLSRDQAFNLINYLRNSNDSKYFHIAKEFDKTAKKDQFLNRLPKDSISKLNLHELRPIFYSNLNNQEKINISKFLVQNEETLLNNSKNGKNTYLYYKGILKDSISTKSIIKKLNSIVSDYNPTWIELKKRYFINYSHWGQFVRLPFSKEFLLRDFILSRPNIWYDAEVGVYPVNYEKLINDFNKLTTKHLNIDLGCKQITHKKDDEYIYEILLFDKNNPEYILRKYLQESGDWYNSEPVVELINLILNKNNVPERWIPIETGDQSAQFIIMNPEKFDRIDRLYKIGI